MLVNIHLLMTNRQLEIINAAGKILSSEGLGGLTIKNIAAEMQFSESAIYRHFKSKEEIILAMLNFLAVDMQERCQRFLIKDTSAQLQLEALFEHQIKHFKAYPYFVSVVFSDGLLEESDRINHAVKKVMNVKYQLLLPSIEKGQAAGEITNEIPGHNIVEILMGAFRLQMFKWKSSRFTSKIETDGNEIMANLISLIAHK